MAESNIEVDSFLAWFSVKTVHASRLEFTLADADERCGDPRIGHETTTYTDQLWDALEKEFTKDKAIRVIEKQEYGDIRFLVEADTALQLAQALSCCDEVVKTWISKYNISRMKTSGTPLSEPSESTPAMA